jgi:hypothetical protein
VDVVYLVRRGDRNDELRYSLRSLVNLPHDKVWIVGHKPRWIADGVGFIPGNRHASKALNVYENVRLACEHADVSDRFVVMNDDIYALTPNPDLGPWIRCTLDHHADVLLAGRRDPWARSVQNTRTWLHGQGIADPDSYEFHYPVELDKAGMLDAMRQVGAFGHPYPPQWRTLYGNLCVGTKRLVEDCKVNRADDLERATAMPVMSTTDGSFHLVRDFLAAQFPDPSPYERAEVPCPT